MEVLLNNVCGLCEEVTAVLSPQCIAPYIKYLHNTFFDKCKDRLQVFQTKTSDRGLCALCSHQVVIAHKFKDSYEDICKKSSAVKKSKSECFLCEQTGVDLIDTDNNPNDFCTKISPFMDTTAFPMPHGQSMVCFDCIFYLNIWYKIYSYIQSKCQNEPLQSANTTPVTLTKAQKKVHFNEDDTVIEINGPGEKIEIRKSPLIRKGSPPPPSIIKKTTFKIKPGPLSTKSKIGTKRNKAVSNRKLMKQSLKRQLKHLKSIKQVNNRKRWSSNILENHKIYLEVPYVLLSREQIQKSKQRKSRSVVNSTQVKSPELIEILDSDSDSAQQSKPTPRFTKKIGFKIKMSAKFLAGPKSKVAKRKQLLAESHDYTCDVCDRILTSLSEYKMHALWHDKPERLFVNITRSDFTDIEKTVVEVENTTTPTINDSEMGNEKTVVEVESTSSAKDNSDEKDDTSVLEDKVHSDVEADKNDSNDTNERQVLEDIENKESTNDSTTDEKGGKELEEVQIDANLEEQNVNNVVKDSTGTKETTKNDKEVKEHSVDENKEENEKENDRIDEEQPVQNEAESVDSPQKDVESENDSTMNNDKSDESNDKSKVSLDNSSDTHANNNGEIEETQHIENAQNTDEETDRVVNNHTTPVDNDINKENASNEIQNDSNDSITQIKKRNHDGDSTKVNSAITENGNDDIPKSKRLKFTDHDSEVTTDEFIKGIEQNEA